MNAWDLIVRNFDYDAILEEYDTALIKFSATKINDDLQ